VRAQALKTLREITGEQVDGVKELLDTIFAQDKATRGQFSITDLLEDPNLDLSNVDFLPSGAELIQFLRRTALDPSVFVRESALQILEIILKTSGSLMAEDCRDSSLAVKKKEKYSLPAGDPFCPMCLRRFWTKKDRDNHMAVLHKKEKNDNFCCKVCDKSYMSEVALQYHKRVHHSTAGAKVKCTVCNIVLAHDIVLRRHMKIHNKEAELFKCIKCDKSFIRKDQLTRHKQSVHKLVSIKLNLVESLKEEVDKYTCKVCHKIFSGSDAEDLYVEHLVRKCKPDERFGCDSCDKDFSTQTNLNQHKRNVHYAVSQTVFHCDVEFCGFLTKHNISLTRHMKRMHSEI
jgi:hypothetical protein